MDNLDNLPLEVLTMMATLSYARLNLSDKDNEIFWDSCIEGLKNQGYTDEIIRSAIVHIRTTTELFRKSVRDIPAETFK